MARVAWSFNGYNFAINPDEDTGWSSEEVLIESSPVGSLRSSVQWTARKSKRRHTSGWIWGPNGPTQKSTMEGWKEDKTVSFLVDHTGNSVKAQLIRFEAKLVSDIAEWKNGRQTYRYDAEWIAMP